MHRLAVLFCLGGLAAPAAADEFPFKTPSGNIQCYVGVGDSSDIDCTIWDRSGPPAAPKPASCRGPWGHRVQMAERGPVSLICGAPGPRNTAPGVEVAPYGQTGRWGGISCSSTPQGLDCRNGSGHGFRLSRASQQVW